MRQVSASHLQFGGFLLGSFAVELPVSKMGSGFFGSVLLLTLITFEPPAAASGYRYGGRSVISHSEQSEGLPRSYKPAASGYNYAQPRASLGGSRLAESAYRPRAAAGGQSSSYGRHVDGHSHQGSVSSYRPASPWSSQPQQTPQQTHQGTNKGKSAVWASPSLQNVNGGFGPRVVSSGAIEIVSEPKLPQQQPESPASSRPQVKPGAWGDSLGARQANAPPRPVTSTSYSSWQKPSSEPTGVVKKWDTGSGSTVQFPHSNKQTGPHPRGPRPVGSSYFSRVERPSSETPGLQTKEGMRETAFPRSRNQLKSVSTSDRAPGVYSKARPLPRQLASSGLLQNKGGKWDAALGSNVQAPRSSKQVGAHPRGTRPMTSTSFSRVQPPSSETPGVLQTKEGMWDTYTPQSGNDLTVSRRVPALYSTPKPPKMESGSSASSKADTKAVAWNGALQSNPLIPRSKPVPLASRYPYEGKRPRGVSVSGRSHSLA